jgi:hypothetical protein
MRKDRQKQPSGSPIIKGVGERFLLRGSCHLSAGCMYPTKKFRMQWFTENTPVIQAFANVAGLVVIGMLVWLA